MLVNAASSALADEIPGESIVLPGSASALSSPESLETYRANDRDDWKFLVSVNPWFVFMAGALDVGPVTFPIDVRFGQIWDNLHMAVMADVEVQKGDFGLLTDITWARLWNRREGRLATTKMDIDWVLFDFGIYWEARSLKLGSGPMPPRLRLQPYIGGRYQYFGTETSVRSISAIPNSESSPVSHVAAPILGLRGFLDIDEHWNLSFVGDGGGFGVDGMQATWQGELINGYRFRFSERADFNVMVGYKGVGVDVRNKKVPVATDLIYHGPVLKFGLEF